MGTQVALHEGQPSRTVSVSTSTEYRVGGLEEARWQVYPPEAQSRRPLGLGVDGASGGTASTSRSAAQRSDFGPVAFLISSAPS